MPSEQIAMQQIAQRLAELVNIPSSEIRFRTEATNVDGILELGPFTFVIEWKGSGLAGPVANAIEQVKRYASQFTGAVPLVVVPYMGDTGKKHCKQADVAWMDLSGNARIYAPGLRIRVEGKPNQFKKRGRPSSAFAPKSSRIARWLLMHPKEVFTQREIAVATGTDEGYTSKVIGKLRHDGLIIKDKSGNISPRDPNILLEAWSESYDFSKHNIICGHIAARSGEELLRKLSDSLKNASEKFAATGLAAAWLMDRFAAFRTTTIYLGKEPSPELLASLSFREEERGANVWLVAPKDEGVFHGASEIDGIRCVHPVQVWLDLKGHPERADEAAKKLRGSHLTWRNDD